MTSLLDSVNTLRNETIDKHFSAAKAEFETKIKLSPLETKFNIYAGCISDDMTEELANKFNNGGIKAKAIKSGWLYNAYLSVESPLSAELVHFANKSESETKSEEQQEAESVETEKQEKTEDDATETV